MSGRPEHELPTLQEHLAQRLDDYQRELIRAQIYVRRAPTDPPVKLDKCRHAVTPTRQCDGPAQVRRGEHWVCKKHERAGGVPFPRSR